jgi:hypothetical protein
MEYWCQTNRVIAVAISENVVLKLWNIFGVRSGAGNEKQSRERLEFNGSLGCY